jgi:hypothetical protein
VHQRVTYVLFYAHLSRPPALANSCLDIVLVSQVIASHIAACRALSFLKQALVVVIPEANLPTIAQHIEKGVHQLGVLNVLFMNEDNNASSEQRNDLPGTITTRKLKMAMMTRMIRDYMEPAKLGFYKQFITAEPEVSVHDDNKRELVKELRNHVQKRLLRTDRDGTPYFEIFYTGMHADAGSELCLIR